MIYGKSIIKPDFERVERKISEQTHFTSGWDTTFGRIVYYVSLIGYSVLIFFIIRWLVS